MENLEKIFEETYNTKPTLKYISPARINLIGEHIDYNGGMVLPAAISRYITALVSKRDDDLLCFKSTAFEKVEKRHLSDLKFNPKYDWANYGFGIFYMLIKEGYRIEKGLNILITSNIPLGSGLSSSASFLNLIGFIANDVYEFGFDMKTIASRSVEVENKYCGLKCGIMDEAAIALGEKDKCLLLNCDNFTYKLVNLNLGKYKFVVLQTNKPRKLTESKYNERVDECQKSLKLLKEVYKDIHNLCDLRSDKLDEIKEILNDDILFKRVRHCITENERVYAFKDALEKGNITKIATLLDLSHKSLKEDYEVTGLHLDTIVEAAKASKAIASRMTGAGFGGCAIALVDEDKFDKFKEKTAKLYFEKTNIIPDIYMVDIVSGPKKIEE